MLFVGVAVLGVAALFAFDMRARKLCCAAPYKTFSSPDQHYRVTVYRIQPPWLAPPGSAGDTPGYVRLETQDGNVLQEQDIDMVQSADQVAWTPDRVEIRLVADWALPAPARR